MKKSKIGIDIGEHEIKCAILEEKGGVYTLNGARKYLIESNLDVKAYTKALKKIIRRFMKEHKIRFATLNFTLPVTNSKSIVKIIDMPQIEEKLLGTSVLNEIESLSLVDLSNFEHKWEVLEVDEYQKESTILSTMLDTGLIKILHDLTSIYCKVESIELQPVTVGRLIKGNAIVIDFGHSSTRVYAYKEGQPIDIQIIPLGGKYLIDKVQEFYGHGIDYKEAKRKLDEVSILPKDILESTSSLGPNELSAFISEEVKKITEDVKRCIRGIEINKNLELDIIYYFGGLVNIGHLVDYITVDLGYPVQMVNFLGTVGDEEQHISNEYLMAAGGILSTNYTYLKGLNYAKRKTITLDLNTFLVVILCMGFAIQVGNREVHKRYDKTIEINEGIIQEVGVEVMTLEEEINRVQMEIIENERIISKVREIEAQKTWLSDVFYTIPDKTPEDIVINKLYTSKGQVRVEGIAQNYKDIGFFAIILEHFGVVDIVSIEDVDDVELEENYVEGLAIDEGSDNTDITKKKEKKFTLTITYNNPRLLNEW